MVIRPLFADMNSHSLNSGVWLRVKSFARGLKACRMLALGFTLGLFSCNRLSMSDRALIQRQDEIVAAAQATVPQFKSFAERFAGTKSFISYITGKQGPPTWNSVAPLHGRYVIEMKCPVSVDHDSFEVTPKGEVAIEIREIIQVVKAQGENPRIMYGKTRKLTAQEANRLLKEAVTLDQLGIILDAKNPTPGFDDYLAY